MLIYYPKQCEDCEIDSIISALDRKISNEITKEWKIRKYLADLKFCKKSFKNLIRFKRIAEKLKYNPDYLGCISVSEFTSKVKIIVK